MDRQETLIAQQTAKTGLRGRVNAKCIECIFDPYSGNGMWRQQVEACTSYACPLYKVRPTSKGAKDDTDKQEISNEQ